MSQSMYANSNSAQENTDEITALLKRSLDHDFRVKNNHSLGTLSHTKRDIRRRKGPAYRKIHTYFKSIQQYKKEKARREQVYDLWINKFYSTRRIAEELGVSQSTIKRDKKKLRPYLTSQMNRLQYERYLASHRKFELLTAGMSDIEKYKFCVDQMVHAMDLTEMRSYNSHKHVVWFDLTDTNKYGIPKLRIVSKGKTLAFPHKIIICVRGEYEGHEYTAQLGTVTLTETRGW